MKKTISILMIAGCTCLVFTAFILNPAPGATFPEEVDKILKASCYGCHSDEGSNKRAPLVLNFDKWDEYKVTKKISRLNNICEMVGKNKMPPAKFLDKNPDKALSDQQRKLICDWTMKESEKLMEGTDE